MYYKYKVGYYNSYEDEETYDEGIVFAKNYGQAANRVTEDYGSDVFDIYLKEIYLEGDGCCLNKEEIDFAFKE